MELQGLLVLCGLGVAGVAVLLLMGLFKNSGTSYEEAIAQQRRATTELLALAENKGKSKKNTKKLSKKQAKKEKRESASVATASEPDESEAPAESGVDEDAVPTKHHVEFKPAVVVDVSRDTPPNVKIRKRGKDQKVKPILLNKDDPSCVSDRSTPPSPSGSVLSNHFEDIHPKDDLELLHSSIAAEKATEKKEEVVEKKESKSGKQAKGKQAAKAPAVEVKEEPVVVKEPVVEVAKEQRKAKKAEKKPQSDETDAPREEVVPPLNAPQPSELTTDKLLKQIPVAAAPAPVVVKNASPTNQAPSKNKKKKQEPNLLALIGAESGGVNVNELVRLVKEASLSRNEIQTLTDVLLNKQHDPLPQHSEWSEGPNDPMQKLKKQLADKEKALADEVEASQALHAKLKELRATLNAERSRGTAATRAAEEAAAEVHSLQVRLQRAADEAHHAAQEKHLLQSKLSAEADAQAQRVQMEMHIQRLTEAEGTLVAQLSVLQGEAGARAHEAGQARCEAAAARDGALLAQQHAAELAQQLQEANRVCAELDAQRQNAIHAEQAAQQEIRQLQERCSALSELQGEVQRANVRAQTAEANADKIKEEVEKQKQQLSSELNTLKEQLAARETELAEVKQLRATSAAPAQNGLPSDDHKSAELSKVESVLAALREELAAAQTSSQEQKEQVASLREQLKHYQDKNNELRTKNWKVMEALQTAEKALQSKPALPAQESLREAISKAEAAQYAEVASVLRAAWPVAAPTGSPSRAWLDAFAARVVEERTKLEQAKPAQTAQSVQSPPDELKAQNEHLQGLVDKYKKIIEDTEGVLSRLQLNVTAEEARWAQQLTEKQRELDELRQKTVTQMQQKIESLEVELRQAKQNHSFADIERQTEDRLLAKLSKLDSANGPLQVGIEEK